VISSLKTDAQDPNSIVIHKPVCFNAFYKTGLGFFLHKIRIDRAEVAGVRASESVLGVVHGLRTRNIPTSVPINCVADPDTSAERFALKQMKKLYGVKVI
jgi:nicotinamidase-related amidase